MRLQNTLSGAVEEFVPFREGRVAMYIKSTSAIPAANCTSDELTMCVATIRICRRRVFSLTRLKRDFSTSCP